MERNPYAKMLELMRKEGGHFNPPSILLAEVISPNPLVIQAGQLQLDRDNLLVADYLLKDYEREVSINNGTKQSIKFTDTVKQGDILAVIPTQDQQTYIVLCKAVSI